MGKVLELKMLTINDVTFLTVQERQKFSYLCTDMHILFSVCLETKYI